MQRVKRQFTEWKKIFIKYVIDKETCIQKFTKKTYKLTVKKDK